MAYGSKVVKAIVTIKSVGLSHADAPWFMFLNLGCGVFHYEIGKSVVREIEVMLQVGLQQSS